MWRHLILPPTCSSAWVITEKRLSVLRCRCRRSPQAHGVLLECCYFYFNCLRSVFTILVALFTKVQVSLLVSPVWVWHTQMYTTADLSRRFILRLAVAYGPSSLVYGKVFWLRLFSLLNSWCTHMPECFLEMTTFDKVVNNDLLSELTDVFEVRFSVV